jgi:putative methyltransferase
MGFFLAGFIRDVKPRKDVDAEFLRDERGHLVRDMMGFPVRVNPQEGNFGSINEDVDITPVRLVPTDEGEDEWVGFGDDDMAIVEQDNSAPLPQDTPKQDKKTGGGSRHDTNKKRAQFGITDKMRKKRKKSN